MTRIRQQLSMTSFEASELEITVNYFPVYTWIERAVSCDILRANRCLFWLVLLTEHKVIACYATNAVYCCLVRDNCTHIVASLQQTVMLPSFQPLSGNSVDRWKFFNHNHNIPLKFSWFCLIFADIYFFLNPVLVFKVLRLSLKPG